MSAEPIATPAELVAAREARGLTADDMQRQLKIHRTQLEALEAGEWDSLPGLSFVRAILRSYGRAIDADVEPLLSAIGGHGAATDIKAAASLRAPIRSGSMLGFGGGGSGSRWTWVSLLVLLLMAVGLFFGRSENSSTGSQWRLPGSLQPEPAASTPAGETGQAAMPASASAGRPAAGSAASDVGHRVTLELIRDGAMEERLQATITPQIKTEGGQAFGGLLPVPLRISFMSDGWAEVTQADGRVLLKGASKANAVSDVLTVGTVTLNTTYPVRLRLEYDGKSVPLELSPGAKTASIRLP